MDRACAATSPACRPGDLRQHNAPVNSRRNLIIIPMTMIMAMSNIDVRDEIAQRIVDAAEQLLAEQGREHPPTVDQVRRAARANIHDVTLVMRRWRQHLRDKAETTLALPESLQRAAIEHGAALFRVAREQAGAAQHQERLAWQQAQDEQAQLRSELEAACAAAEQERDAATVARAAMAQERDHALTLQAAAEAALHDAQRDRDVARGEVASLGRHVDDLREQLTRAHAHLADRDAALAQAHADAAQRLEAWHAHSARRDDEHLTERRCLQAELDTMRQQYLALLTSVQGRLLPSQPQEHAHDPATTAVPDGATER